jgi:hypothetical protein
MGASAAVRAATEQPSRAALDRIDESSKRRKRPEQPRHPTGRALGIDTAPFFIVRDDAGEQVYTSHASDPRSAGKAVSDQSVPGS